MKYKSILISLCPMVLSTSILLSQWTNAEPTVHNGDAQLNDNFPRFVCNVTSAGGTGGFVWTNQGSTVGSLTYSPAVDEIRLNYNLHVDVGADITAIKTTGDLFVNGTTSMIGKENNGSAVDAVLRLFDGGAAGMYLDANEIDVFGDKLFLNFNSNSDIILGQGGGKIGIGTQTPTHKFTAVGNSLIRGSDNNGSIATLELNTGGSSKMLLDDNEINTVGKGLYLNNLVDQNIYAVPVNGNLGIGTTSPTHKLSAIGGTYLKGADNNGTIATLEIVDTDTNEKMLLDANEIDAIGEKLYLNFNSSTDIVLGNGGGNIGIGTASPAQKLHVAGDATVAGFVAQPSDLKLKEDINKLSGSLERVLNLHPKTYRYRVAQFSEMGLPKRPQTGFIAQEVEKIFPEIVLQKALKDREGNNYKGIDYERLIPHLVGAIQEQHEMLLNQQEEIKLLKEQLKNSNDKYISHHSSQENINR